MPPIGQQDFPAHPQIEQQPALRRLELQPLAVRGNVLNGGARKRGPKFLRRQIQAFGLQHLHLHERPAGQFLLHVAGENGDLR